VYGISAVLAADRANGRVAILIVDDDPDFIEAVTGILERAGYSPVIASRGEEALHLARTQQPRLVILDVGLPDLSGYEVCRQLKERFGDGLPILFVSGLRTESFDRVAGLLIGADDYLGKPFAADELLARVRRLVRQTASLAPSIASKLTPRELEVLRHLANGLGQDEIARQLFISRKTVATHIEHVLQKLGVRTRAQAVAMAYREDLVLGAS
jgi:two-component system catabolic regulation response regulator CreB